MTGDLRIENISQPDLPQSVQPDDDVVQIDETARWNGRLAGRGSTGPEEASGELLMIKLIPRFSDRLHLVVEVLTTSLKGRPSNAGDSSKVI